MSADSPSAQLVPGQMLQQYRILEQIGKGGMGVVFRAEDTRLGRVVAIKVLASGHSADAAFRTRLLREARASAALNHPNIVAVHEIGSDRGIDFIVMEYVEGSTIAARLKAGPLALADALSWGAQAAAGLARAHSAGIVHRDVKPGNAMVNPEGLVKVVDFGLALLPAKPDEETRAQLTGTGEVMATVGYMSPEQLRAEPLDARTDVFSFGAMLYEMLAGVRPFRGPTAASILQATLFGSPERLEKLRPELPPEVAACVHKCLEKDRAARYATLEPVAALLKPTSGDTGRSLPVAAAPLRRRRWRWLAAAGAVLGLLAAALSPWGQQWLAEARTSSLLSAIRAPGEVPRLVRQGHLYLQRFDRTGNTDLALEAFQRAISSQRTNAAAYAGLSLAYAQKYVDNPDPQWLRLAESNARRALEINAFLAQAHVAAGRCDHAAGRYADAVRKLRRALELDARDADAQLYLGSSLSRLRKPAEAETVFRELITAAPQDWRGYHFLGAQQMASGRLEEAMASFQKAGGLAPDNIAVLKLLALALQRMGKLDEAASVLQKALAIQQSSQLLNNLGDVCYKAGRYADAADAFRRAVAVSANDHVIWGNLGDALRFVPGGGSESQEAFRQAIRLLDRRLQTAPQDVSLHALRGLYLASSGDGTAAAPEIERVATAASADAQSLFAAGLAAELSGRREQALLLIGRAAAARLPASEVENHPDLVALRRDSRYAGAILNKAAPTPGRTR